MPPLPILQVITPLGLGSAVFIADDLIVTAGHVLQPHTPAPTPGFLVRIHLPDGSEIRPTACLCHPRWTTGFNATADMAVMRVSSMPGLAVAVALDVPAASLAVAVAGFQFNGNGSITRVAHPGGFDALISSDLAFPQGVSGGPFFTGATAIGLATWSTTTPTPSSFVGVPFLAQTLGWLRAHCA